MMGVDAQTDWTATRSGYLDIVMAYSYGLYSYGTDGLDGHTFGYFIGICVIVTESATYVLS